MIAELIALRGAIDAVLTGFEALPPAVDAWQSAQRPPARSATPVAEAPTGDGAAELTKSVP
jgi:hypothetical protein